MDECSRNKFFISFIKCIVNCARSYLELVLTNHGACISRNILKREYRLVRGELSGFLIINQSCEKLRLLFLPTLLSYSSRFLRALQQKRAHSRPIFLLTNVES